MRLPLIRETAALVLIAFATGALRAQDLGPLRFMPGDDAVAPSIGPVRQLAIAAGGPGFLAVWSDNRTVISGQTNAPGDPNAGNMEDIYGQLLDETGAPIGPPVIVANVGRNQRDPRLAWNGQNWLVAFESEDPDWYFDDQVLAVRVSPTGEALDAEPIFLFGMEDNQGAYDPAVASDGQNWLVVCDQWVGGQRTVRARRVAPDGTVIDAQPRNIQQSSSLQYPVVDFAGGVYLLAANSYSQNQFYVRTFDPNLNPLTSLTSVGPATPYQHVALASNGSRFLAIGDRAHRIEPNGANLDPSGIALGGSETASWIGSAWTGTHWIASMRTFSGQVYYDVKAQRISNSGALLDPQPRLVETAPQGLDNFEAPTGVAGAGNGDAAVAFIRRNLPMNHSDVRAARIDAGGNADPAQDISIGLPRQSYTRLSEGDESILAVYVSETSGSTRILSQRMSPDGDPIDAEPNVIVEINEEGPNPLFTPSVEWNGSTWLVVWRARDGGVVGVRVSPDNVVLDPVPLRITPGAPGGEGYAAGAVAAAGDTFVVGIFHTINFHEPVRYAEFVRVSAAGDVLDPLPVFVAGGFSSEMTGEAFAADGFLAWAQYGSHDSSASYIQGVIVHADGSTSGSLSIGATGMEPDIAPAGDRALVVWQDDTTIHQDDIKGRFIAPGGSFLGGEFTISGAAHPQMTPAAAFDGSNFVVAWTDFRHQVGQVDQLRGDIIMARVDADGTVLDPSGVQVTEGPLPETLPDVASAASPAIIAFSMLHGEERPEIQRFGYRILGGAGGGPVLTMGGTCPGSMQIGVTGATPGGNVALLHATGTGSVRIPNGNPCAGTTLGLNSTAQLYRVVRADGNGSLSLDLQVPAQACGRYVQALDAASCATSNVARL
ncbi:MAG: hypothetical protein IT430_17405 [Phycisphaerales bacterium]|nr:hypothetical protein [Phycisphaerales bacterium]